MALRTTSLTKAKRKVNSSPSSAIIIAVAVIVAAVILSRGTRETPVSATPAYAGSFGSRKVWVALEPVSAGTRVSDIRGRYISLPDEQIPAGAIMDPAELPDGSVALASLPAALPIVASNFSSAVVPTSLRNPVIERIPAGMRAMTVHVDATSSVEGWAGSGAIVDVLLIEDQKTTVVAERVRILSAERSVSPVEGEGTPNVPSTVTLLVTQEQCLAISTAIPRGRIAFALRSGADDESWRDTVFTSDMLRGAAPVGNGRRGQISGYAAISEGRNQKSFALNNGHWIKTEEVPEGFMVANE